MSTTNAEDKRIRAITKSAAFLQSCYPPNRQAGAARTLAKLGGPKPDIALLETLLAGTTYTRLSPVDCPNPSCLRSFLFSECNRDGDAYRCVWCNKLVHGDGSYLPPDAPAALPKSLRALERSFNLAFIDYTNAYFGSSALVNCYVSPRNEYDTSLVTVTILIRKVVEDQQQAAAASEGEAADSLSGSLWNSSHTISMRLDRDYQIDVASSSTVYIESQAPPCRFSGHVTKPNPKFSAGIPERLHGDFEASRADMVAFCSRSADARTLLIVAVGDLVQRAENRLRDVIGSIYFGKSAQVGTDLRCPIGRTEHTQTRMMTAVTGSGERSSTQAFNFPSVDSSGKALNQQQQQQLPSIATHFASAQVPGTQQEEDNVVEQQKPEVSYWEADADDNGDTFYTNVETGDAVWELPDGGVLQEKKATSSSSKKDKTDKKDKKRKNQQNDDDQEAEQHRQQQPEVEEGVQGDGGDEDEEWTVSSVLYSLELAGDVEEYVALLSAAEVNSVEELLQCDKDYLKDSVGISSSNDRKKISKWINETYDAVNGGGGDEAE